MAKGGSVSGGTNRFRIIGGAWRGRRLEFPALAGIRPSPDRVRETLFNWLAPVIEGARCLDLFAGSGALGLEALSRGAADCLFVDRERAAVEAIRAHLLRLGAAGGRTCQAEALAFLAGPAEAFDVVLLDPPYAAPALLGAALRRLAGGGWLASGARIYLEAPAQTGPPELPEGWLMLRSKRAGQVGYHLAIAE